MSERASLSLPRTCSGDMYCSVPTMWPWRVSRSEPEGARDAEVHHLHDVLLVFSIMFEPLMSRWMIPRSWA